MTNPQKRNILIFSHHPQAAAAARLKSEIEQLKPGEFDVSVKLLDDSSNLQKTNLDQFGAYIILYSSQLAKNENLYRLIKHFENQGNLQRFLVLPQQDDGTIPLPPIFHTIRAQQHHIYAYRRDESSEGIDLSPIEKTLIEDVSDHLWQMGKAEKAGDTQEPKTVWGKLNGFMRSKRGKTLLIMIPVFIVLILAIIYLVPMLAENMQAGSVVFDPSMKPETFNAFWLDEDFYSVDNSNTWEIANQYRGKIPLNSYTLSGEYMTIYANENISEAEFTLQSREHWPLDEFTGLQSTFQLETVQSVDADAVLTYEVVLAGDDAYSFGCNIRPLMNEGNLECFIADPQEQEKVIIPYPEALSLNEWHALTIEFNPRSYALRFFIDDAYFGQAAIPSVEQWKSKDFNAVIQITVNDLQESPFSIKIKRFQLAYQDR